MISRQKRAPAPIATVARDSECPRKTAQATATNSIIGESSSTLSAIVGMNFSDQGNAVVGSARPGGFEVFAQGNLGASGAKSFRIDHPLDPEHKFLRHYCSEGPEPLNVYSGTATTDANGLASIVLPDYFESINRDPRVLLTVEDASDEFVLVKVVSPVRDGRFAIGTSKPRVKVYWEVKAVRNDLWVQRHGAPVEEDKPEAEHGLYQHPDLYGLTAEYEMSNGLIRSDQTKPTPESDPTRANSSRGPRPVASDHLDPH